MHLEILNYRHQCAPRYHQNWADNQVWNSCWRSSDLNTPWAVFWYSCYIAQVTLTIIYLYYKLYLFIGSKYPKNIQLLFKNKISGHEWHVGVPAANSVLPSHQSNTMPMQTVPNSTTEDPLRGQHLGSVTIRDSKGTDLPDELPALFPAVDEKSRCIRPNGTP